MNNTIVRDAAVRVVDNLSTLNTKTNVLESRMNTFTALPEGATTNDAALEDIKVGYDGTVYASPGTAVRSQVGQLSSEITNINDSLGLFKESDIINVSPTPIYTNYELFTGLALPHGSNINVKVEMMSGQLDVIQINANNRFVRSIEKSKFGEFVNIELRNDTYLPASDNPIITNIGFRVDEEYYTSDISFRITIYTNGLQADVDRLMKNDIIPPYYHNHLNEKCNKINSEVGNIQSGDVFIFVTDQHIAGNTLTSFPLMETVIQKTSCNKVVFGGDIPANYGTQEECNEQIVTWRKGFKKLSCNSEIFVVRGNHDISINDNGEFYLSNDSEVYNNLMRSFEKETMINRKNYYYHDIVNQKIRYIFVDCYEAKNETTYIPYISQEQINWLIDKLNVNEDWSVVVFGHGTCDSKMVDYNVNMTNLFNILKAYKNKTLCESNVNNITVNKDFTSYNGDLVAYICGHNHKDEGVVTDNVISISTTCDALYQDDVHVRTKGTTSESAFDVFVIDTTLKSIKAIRIGAGNNREWNY